LLEREVSANSETGITNWSKEEGITHINQGITHPGINLRNNPPGYKPEE